MRFFALAAALTSFSLAAAQSQRILVTVGANNGLTYEPTTATGKAGDVLAFQFQSKNHTVTQSTFDAPCTFKTGGVDSGFLPVQNGSTQFSEWSFTIVNDTAPMWFYCAQGQHCKAGMVFALNPSAERTFDAFKATAMGSTTNTSGAATPAASGSAMGLVGSKAGVMAAVGLAAGLLL
jgi:plastocyanin